MPVLLALDAGTGGAKGTVFDLDGRQRSMHFEAWSYEVHAHPDMPVVKSYAFDPHHFWGLLSRCAREALAKARVAPAEVVGVATTSQREGCVFLDANGAEIYAGPNLDGRGFQEGLEVLFALGPEHLYSITGHSAPFIFALARYLWFRKHDARSVAHVLMINDWMTYRLTGALGAEPSNASESMLFDFRRREWSAEVLDRFEIPASVLPPIYASGQRIGSVTPAAAAATGIAAGTPVFVGGADTQCSLLGCGAVQPGDTAVILGTTTPIQTVVGQPTLDPASNLWAGCHVVPDRWVIEANVGGGGDGYQWLIDLLVPPGDDRYGRAEVLAAGATDPDTYSFIGPRIFDLTKVRPDMPGGIFFRFPTMQLRPGPGALLRSFLDSLGFAVRANLAQIEAVTGALPPGLFAGGGMTRNGLLLQILADVTGLPVRCAAEPECTGLGCAILVAVGAGVYPDIPSAVSAMCRHRDIAPDAGRHRSYGAPFAKWRELYDTLDQLSI